MDSLVTDTLTTITFTTSGKIFMALSWGIILALVIFSFVKVLSPTEDGKVIGPLEVEAEMDEEEK